MTTPATLPTGPFTFIGVGAGPSNLSLAALAAPHSDLTFRVFEKNPEIEWHPGMMVRNAALQVAPIKDLVTMVDPTSPYSFHAFLKATGRLYRSLIAHRSGVSRQEYHQYYQWAAAQLGQVELGSEVYEVDFRDGYFDVTTSRGRIRAANVVAGVGRAPAIPLFAGPALGPRVFHSSRYTERRADLAGSRVLVVGGGQSAAEIVLDVLSGTKPPRSLTWATGRSGLFPLDDSPFANEWYNPAYVEHFFTLSADHRERLLSEQTYSSDGASEGLLQQIYARLYELDYITPGVLRHQLLLGHRLMDLKLGSGEAWATLACKESGSSQLEAFDHVVLATGYEDAVPAFLNPLRNRLTLDDGRFTVRRDYRAEWDGPGDRGIYVQNSARHTHGVADPNLALISWRSANILNSLCGSDRYDLRRPDITIALP